MPALRLPADLTVIAVGVANYNFPELREIATDPETHVFTAKDFDELINLVVSLRKKACTGEFISELKGARAAGSSLWYSCFTYSAKTKTWRLLDLRF